MLPTEKTIRKTSIVLCLIVLFIANYTSAQRRTPSKENYTITINPVYKQKSTAKQGWSTNAEFGFSFLSNFLINPPKGGGDNRLSFGGVFNLFNTYNNGKFGWKNEINLAYGVQKVGSGYLEEFPDEKIPFTKNIDNFRYYSKIVHRHSYFSNFYYTLDVFFSSQLTPTFEDNSIRDVQKRGQPIADFLSPALFQASLGVDYQPTKSWSIFLSPAAYKTIIVLNDDIANDFIFDEEQGFLGSVHGNRYRELPDGTLVFENFDHQIGGALRVTHKTQGTKRISINSNLLLFSNYQRNPSRIDVNWRNEVNLRVFKGLQLSLLSLLSYDHDTFVTVSNKKKADGTQVLGRRVSSAQQISLKYRWTFDNTKPKNKTKKEKGRIYD